MTTKKTTNQEINDRLRAAFGHPTQEPEQSIPDVHGGEGIQDITPSKPNQEINDAIIRIARGLGRFDKLFKAGK
jgi:hypothetical protein